jgi:LmbE family N-acetylglucosaminyl deacetylase
MVLCATRGEAGQIRDASVATRSTLGDAREQELRAACAALGVHHVRLLDHIDGTLASLDRELLVREVREVLGEFEPDVVVTFGDDGAYGHPDHVTIGRVTTEACGPSFRGRLYHSHFPRSRLLLLERLAEWLAELNERFKGSSDFARVFSLFAQETNTLGYADDHISIAWFPPGFAIVEQGEAAEALYLILSGSVEVLIDDGEGRRQVRMSGPGEFFGEIAVAQRSLRTADVIAAEPVTCMVFTRRPPSLSAGRGTTLGGLADQPILADQQGPSTGGTTVVDVREVIDQKIAAVAAHRSQYPIEPEMFPRWMLEEMMGHEHFVRVRAAVEPETELM